MTPEPAVPTPPGIRWRVFPAIVIVAVGALFLANNLGFQLDFLERHNWWAIIILVAAIAPLTRAWEIHRVRGGVDAEVAHCLLSAMAIVLVAVMFLAELDWGTWWPLFVILGGLYTLVPQRRGCGRRSRYGSPAEDEAIR